MYVGELTLHLSLSSWMYIAYISLLVELFSPLCWWLTKRGRSIFEFIYASLFHFLVLYKKGEKDYFIQNGEKGFWGFLHICLFSFMHFIEFLYVYCYAWVKGEILWNLTLIHAYITPWVLSSSKGGDYWPEGPSL